MLFISLLTKIIHSAECEIRLPKQVGSRPTIKNCVPNLQVDTGCGLEHFTRRKEINVLSDMHVG